MFQYNPIDFTIIFHIRSCSYFPYRGGNAPSTIGLQNNPASPYRKHTNRVSVRLFLPSLIHSKGWAEERFRQNVQGRRRSPTQDLRQDVVANGPKQGSRFVRA